MEKKHQTNDTLLEIKNDNNIFKSNGEILHEMCPFYENLYIYVSTYLQYVKCLKLNDQEKKFCDSLPTIYECTDAVNY